MTWILTTILNWLGGNALDKVLGHLETRVNNETERQRIRALRDQHMATVQAGIITTAMQHKVFWVPWSFATCSMSLWFGIGMLNTTFPGYFPVVATIPPGLEPWAKGAWDSLFFSGAGVAGASILAGAIRR